MVYPGIPLKNLGPTKVQETDLVLPDFLKTGKVGGNVLA